MTGPQEYALYLTDPEAWATYVAPRWLKILRESTETERKRLWALSCKPLKAAIRARHAQEAA